jgi:hypothetical protein
MGIREVTYGAAPGNHYRGAGGKVDLGFVQRAWKWVGIVTRIKGRRK